MGKLQLSDKIWQFRFALIMNMSQDGNFINETVVLIKKTNKQKTALNKKVNFLLLPSNF